MVTKEQLINSIMERHYQFSMVAYIHPVGDTIEIDKGFSAVYTACIAGFAVLLEDREWIEARPSQWIFDWNGVAEEILGLKCGDGQVLFNTRHWPRHLRNAYWEASMQDNSLRCAQIACEVIEMYL